MRLAALLVLAGCAAAPQYRTQLVPVGSPSVSSSQAAAICRPRADTAYLQAEAAARSRIEAQRRPSGAVSCTSSQAGAYRTTECQPAPSPYAPGVAAFDAMTPGAEASAARDRALVGCLAEQGYQVTQICVANCR